MPKPRCTTSLSKSQAGLAHLGLIIVAVFVIGIIGFAGYAVTRKHKSAPATPSNSATQVNYQTLKDKKAQDAITLSTLLQESSSKDYLKDPNNVVNNLSGIFAEESQKGSTWSQDVNKLTIGELKAKYPNFAALFKSDADIAKASTSNTNPASTETTKAKAPAGATGICNEAHRVYDTASKQCVRDCAYSEAEDVQYYWTDKPSGQNTCVKQKNCPGGNVVKGIKEHRCYRDNSVASIAGTTNKAAEAKCAELKRVYDGKNGCKRQCVNQGYYLQNQLSGWDKCDSSKEVCNLGDGWAADKGYTTAQNDSGKTFYKCLVELSTPTKSNKAVAPTSILKEITCPEALKYLNTNASKPDYNCGNRPSGKAGESASIRCSDNGFFFGTEAKYSERRAVITDPKTGKKYLSKEKICLAKDSKGDKENADKNKKPEDVKCSDKTFNGKDHAKKAYEYLSAADKKKYKCINNGTKSTSAYVKLPDGNTYKMSGLTTAANYEKYWQDFCAILHRDPVPNGCAAFGADNRGCKSNYVVGSKYVAADNGSKWRECVPAKSSAAKIDWARFCKSINRPHKAKDKYAAGCDDGCSPASYKVDSSKRYRPTNNTAGTGWRACKPAPKSAASTTASNFKWGPFCQKLGRSAASSGKGCNPCKSGKYKGNYIKPYNGYVGNGWRKCA